MRKTSRGASRTQRRRRSKSPILHPPKFTYCSTAATSALSTSSGCLKHQRLAVPELVELHPAVEVKTAHAAALPAQKELSPSGTTSHISPLVFGSAYEIHTGAVVSSTSLHDTPLITAAAASPGQNEGSSGNVRSSEESGPEKGFCSGAKSRAGAPRRSGSAESADFRALSQLHSSAEGPHVPCSCTQRVSSGSQEEAGPGAEPQCRCQSHEAWHGVEVYSFTGLRDVISECERSREDAPRTLGTNSNAATASSPLSSGSPRSCSEQARAFVDDITIEDLSGYMEYYLYIPKKMSHMAEMMYT